MQKFIDPVLFKTDDNPEVTVIIHNQICEYKKEDSLLKATMVKTASLSDMKDVKSFPENSFKILLRTLKRLLPSFQVLSPFGFIPDTAKLSTNKKIFYKENCIDLKDYIKPYSKIITEGDALFSISGKDIGSPEWFYDTLLEETSFYAPELKSEVFPIDNFFSWKMLDNFERNFAMYQIKKAKDTVTKKQRFVKPQIELIENVNGWLKETLHSDIKVAVDTETTGLDFIYHYPFYMSISFDGKKGYFMMLDNVDKELLSQWFRGKKLIMANGKFDIKMLYKLGVSLDSMFLYFDTMNAHHVVNEMQGHSLKFHSWYYDVNGGYDKDLDNYKKKYSVKNYKQIPTNILSKYAGMDAVVTYRVYEKLKERIELLDEKFPMEEKESGMNLHNYFYDVVMPAVRVFTELEIGGMFINESELEKIGNELQTKINNIENEIFQEFGLKRDQINIYSGDQLGSLLEKKGWKDYGRSKKGIYLTNDECLQRWKKDGKRGAELLLELRAKNTLMKTFVGKKNNKSGMWQYVRKHDDGTSRVHSQFAVMMADSGRMKSRNPNLQNQPNHGESALLTKRMFQPPNEDFVFLSADQSGLQLRIASMFSEDETMKDAFVNRGGDLHSLTASLAVLNNKYELEEFLRLKSEGDPEITEARQIGKTLNFALLFGSGVSSLYRLFIEPNWSQAQAEDFVLKNNLKVLDYQGKCNYKFTVADFLHKKFFETYSGLVDWSNKSKVFAMMNGYIRSPHGAFRRLPFLYNKFSGSEDEGKRRSNKESISLNSPVQNFESVVMVRAGIEIHNWLKENNMKSKVFSFIHDAIELYVHRDELEIVCRKVKEVFEKEYPEYKGIPLEMEGNVADFFNKNELWDMGHNWDCYL